MERELPNTVVLGRFEWASVIRFLMFIFRRGTYLELRFSLSATPLKSLYTVKQRMSNDAVSYREDPALP